ncbi:hypothetical protein [Phreatobacter sp. AB_2022a]|uniref:hypothetical protein n=1 Tax=Phreatobacter sp. AB_2022a TaxID=3003134 RepID=UPI002286FBF0|nr:hypothetical protein [Phreatobacter sp. AB_2022a]MCZ0734509.1 hypothetical protein [Phreatobacter sp. AB_2022a]
MEVERLGANSDWTYLVQRPPASEILSYLVAKWQEYEALYSGIGEPFANRDEPTLTEGFAAYLDAQYHDGRQPFHGEFFAELKRYDLRPDGKRVIIGRSDIEWRLSGSPNFIVECKVIGNGRPAKAYVTDGMVRFVDGRYGPRSAEGAMWAFLRPGSTETTTHVEAIIDSHLEPLKCQVENGMHRIAPSTLAPMIASFDSLHLRAPSIPPIRLAHIFVSIAPHPISSPETI